MELALELAQRNEISVNLALNGIIALIAGILIFVVPRFLNYIVGGYLIFIGLVDIFNIRL